VYIHRKKVAALFTLRRHNDVGVETMNTLSSRGFADTGFRVESPPVPDGELSMLMDELAYGMLVIRLDGQVLHTNQAARHELGRTRLLTIIRNRLQAIKPDHSKALQAAIGRVAQGKRSMITLGGHNHDSSHDDVGLTLAIIPLGSNAVKAAVLLQRPSVCESLTLCFFARSHGLTNTEEQVLGILCQGYSAPQIAVEMKVAVSTVRSHVRSLCAKTYSSGVRQLIGRVAMLPPVVPALRYEQMH
jgi:DNA-binding CsgD family transcriptional regulator